MYAVQSFKPTDLRRQYGFGLGGPILKDKVFFFIAGDRFYHDFPAAATITGTSANSNFYTQPDATLPSGKDLRRLWHGGCPVIQDAKVCQIFERHRTHLCGRRSPSTPAALTA